MKGKLKRIMTFFLLCMGMSCILVACAEKEPVEDTVVTETPEVTEVPEITEAPVATEAPEVQETDAEPLLASKNAMIGAAVTAGVAVLALVGGILLRKKKKDSVAEEVKSEESLIEESIVEEQKTEE